MQEEKVIGSVSIVVPVYKVERTLDRCMASLLKQDMQPLEIILVDDGSPDNSGKICDDYAAKHSHIRVVHKQNGGLGSARNAGIEASLGDYICFIDSDDYVTPNYLSSMYNAITANNADIAIAGYELKRGESCVSCSPQSLVGVHDLKQSDFLMQEYAKGNAILYFAWNKLFRKSVIVDNGIRYSDRHCAEDMYFNVLFYARADIVVVIPDCIYSYIMEGTNTLSSRRRPNFWPDMKLVLAAYRQIFAERNIDDQLQQQIGNLTLILMRNAISNYISNEKFNLKAFSSYVRELCTDPIVRDALPHIQPRGKMDRLVVWFVKLKMYRGLALMIWLKSYIKAHSFKLFAFLRNRN